MEPDAQNTYALTVPAEMKEVLTAERDRLSALLNQLRQQRRELGFQITELETNVKACNRLLGEDLTPIAKTPAPVAPAHPSSGLSQSIIRLLNGYQRGLTVREVLGHISPSFPNTFPHAVANCLSDLKRRGKVTRVGHRYQLISFSNGNNLEEEE